MEEGSNNSIIKHNITHFINDNVLMYYLYLYTIIFIIVVLLYMMMIMVFNIYTNMDL